MVQPDVFAVAVSTKVVAVVSPDVGTERMSHFPATSARLMGAGAAGAVVVSVEDAIAIVSTAALSFLAHPERTAAQRHSAMLVERCSGSMEPPVSGYGPLLVSDLLSPANVW
jgi:hypothetical protein